MAAVADWIGGARPKTLPAAVAPVIVGTSVAWWEGAARWDRAALALIVALALQVGVNYSNDYSDGIRGTDDHRPHTGGPIRLVGQQLARPKQVLAAAMLNFLIAAVAGLALVVMTQQWWLLGVGAAAIAGAWFYTGGPRPYGYAGFGEVFVFVFFGIVAVMGTAYVQTLNLTVLALLMSITMGAYACAILVANNLRDRASDAVSGKRTLAVRLGDARTRVLYSLLVFAGVLIPVIVTLASFMADWPVLMGLASVAAFAVLPSLRAVWGGATGRDLVAVLAGTARGQLVSAVLSAVAVGASRALWG